MFKPVEALVAFIATLPGGAQPTMFAPRGVTILENFAPFVFVGIDAVVQWERGFRRHSVEGALTELAVAFGRAQDFSVTRGRAFFVLPATWTGRAAGRLFDEKGAWSFLLARAGAGWKILGYGWGVTSKETRSRSRRA